MAKIELNQLINVAFAIEEGDPIDWGVFINGQEQAMRMIGASIIEHFDKDEFSYEDRLIAMATITKVVTENMILHARLLAALNDQGTV